MLSQVFRADDMAEKDNELWKYFVETSSYKNAYSGRKLIIIGRKGSGKSAICQQLRRSLPKDGRAVIYLSPEEDDQYRLRSKLAIIDKINISPAELEFHFRYIWRATLKCELARLISENSKIPEGRGVKRIKEFVKKHYRFDKSREQSKLASALINLFEIITINIGGGSIEKANKRPVLEISDLKHYVDELTDDILEAIRVNYPKGIHILVDNLDEFWDRSNASLAFFRGLISATVDIAEPKLSVFPILFISTDVFMQVAPTYRNIDKIHQYEEEIKWKRGELIELVSKRIQAYFSHLKSKSLHEVWNEIFPPKVGRSSSFNYILDRTLLRPRDILQFCRLAGEKASYRNSTKIDAHDIKSAEYTFSDWKATDLLAEHHYSLPMLKEIMEQGFKRKTIRWSVGSLLRLLNELLERLFESNKLRTDIPRPSSHELMETLYRIGLTKAVVENRRTQSAEEPQLPSKVDYFEIHPAFWKFLNVKFPNLRQPND